MHRIVIAMSTLLLAASCDSTDPARVQEAAPAPAASPTPSAPSGPAETAQGAPGAAAAGPFASLSECLSSCDRPGVLATNQATCRLNCDAAYGASASGPRAGAADLDAVTRAGECLGTCYGGSSSPDTCARGCKATATGDATPLAADVLDRLDTCIRTCHADTQVLPTNRKTCELNCTQRARVAATPPPDAAAPASP